MKKKKILILDDDLIIRKMFTTKFCEEFEIVESKNAKEALSLVDKTFDLCVLDIDLGAGKSGMDVLEEIKEKYKEMPVIMLSSHADAQTVVNNIKLGAVDFIDKTSISVDLLHQKITEIFKG